MSLIDKEMLSQQLKLESQMKDRGQDRFHKRQQKQKYLSKSESHHQVILNALEVVSKQIRLDIDNEFSKGSGRVFLWATLLKDIDTDTLAYIGLNEMMDCAGNNSTLTTCVTNIGRRIEAEVWAEDLKEFSKPTYKAIQEKVTKEHSKVRHRLKAAKTIASFKGFTKKKWELKNCVTAAMPIVNAILEFSKVFYIHEEYSKNKTVRHIRIFGDIQESLNNNQEFMSWQEPMFSAMLIPPRPWESIDTGCYYDEALSSLVPLVKDATYDQKQFIKRDFDKAALAGELPHYVQAVNALQEVPLVINTRVLELIEWSWDQGKQLGKFPNSRLLEEPQRLDNWKDLTRVEQQRHVSDCKKIRQKNDETRCNVIIMDRDLKTAKDLSVYDKFYLPWNLDSRGRVYPVSAFNYHRDDHIKSMFSLANGTALCDESDEWLMIHIANLGDFGKVSKKSLEDRVAWFKDNERQILNILIDPQLEYDFWSEADKPFQFLAACLEWGSYKVHGNGYLCCIAPALDASNSGCQHYSAASLSEDTGKLVNLVPTEEPQDVYQTLVDKVVLELQSMSQDKSLDNNKVKLAIKWLDYGLTRKDLKTNCMTYVYSSVEYGFYQQLFKQIMEDLEDKVLHSKTPMVHPFGSFHEQTIAAKFLAKISYRCVQEVLESAKEGMEFFKECAGALAEDGKPMFWRTPINFPVIQKYTRWDTKKVKVYLYDRVLKSKRRSVFSLKADLTDERSKPLIDRKKSRSGISPNVIHSMDSSHLMATVLELKKHGINDFMMIHDSFAVPPKHSWDLFHIVRQTFVNQYDGWCLYDHIYKSTQQQLSDPDKIKDLKIPKKGSLDLVQVAQSDFCFA